MLLIAALTALTACGSGGGSQVAHVGSPAPTWTLPTSGGQTLALSSMRGKAVYLNFFATWCPPCNEEAPYINQFQKEFASQGLQIVGVDELENRSKAQQFVDKYKLVYPALVDNGTLQSQYSVNGLPVHVFIDRSGVIKKIVVGEMSKAQIVSDIRAIL